MTSATAFALLGVANKILSLIVAALIWEPPNLVSTGFLVLCLAAALVYSRPQLLDDMAVGTKQGAEEGRSSYLRQLALLVGVFVVAAGAYAVTGHSATQGVSIGTLKPHAVQSERMHSSAAKLSTHAKLSTTHAKLSTTHAKLSTTHAMHPTPAKLPTAHANLSTSHGRQLNPHQQKLSSDASCDQTGGVTAGTGRTAICMTGLLRSFPMDTSNDMLRKAIKAIGGHPSTKHLENTRRDDNNSWTGPRGGEHPEWLIAHSIRNHVLSVLGKHGGYDLFIIEPGVSKDMSKWSVLDVGGVGIGGVPNRMFVMEGGPEPDLYYNRSDDRWRSFYHTKRLGGFNHAHGVIEGEIYQVKHQLMCNDAVRKYAASSGTRYTYKMRLRPDFAWARPFPPPCTMASIVTSTTVVTSDPKFYRGGVNDTFVFGLAAPMDVFLDRAPYIWTWPYMNMWQNEVFTEWCMVSNGISFKSHKDIQTFCVRPPSFTRGTRDAKGDADPNADGNLTLREVGGSVGSVSGAACAAGPPVTQQRDGDGREAFLRIKERHNSDINDGVSAFIVITSINPPTRQMETLCSQTGWNKVVAGDGASPKDWKQRGCVFLSVEDQRDLRYAVTDLVPMKRYERKIFGYLFAIEAGATVVLDTDDDNIQLGDRPVVLDSMICAQTLSASRIAWNSYGHFGKPNLWNRGLPLDQVQTGGMLEYAGPRMTRPLIQQGLADMDPDLDAIARLLKPRSDTDRVRFDVDKPMLSFEQGSYQPMNSQNTVFLHEALWALILPVTTLWREDDIYRGYWSQRLLWELGASLVYTGPTAQQLRNPHDYLKDLAQEIHMYRDTAIMLRTMNEWRCPETVPFASCMVQLQLALHEHKFIGCQDVHLVSAFISDLLSIGYAMPARRPWNLTVPLGPACQTPAKLPADFVETSRERRSMTREQMQATFDHVACGQGAARGCTQTVLPDELAGASKHEHTRRDTGAAKPASHQKHGARSEIEA